MKEVLYHRIFEGKPFGHGGERRALQLQEMMTTADVECHYFPVQGKGGHRLFWSLRLIMETYGWRLWLHPKNLWRVFCFINHNYTHNLRQFFGKPIKTLLIEGTIEAFQVIFPLARRYNKEVIAFPHNLESLVPRENYWIGRHEKWQTFYNEIHWLQTCKAVYCISEEETWLLRLWGVNAHYLPYEPPQETRQYLEEIAVARKKRTKNNCLRILMTGSAINQPTAQGMQEVINIWNTMVGQLQGINLRIIGYGTVENLSVQSNDANVVLLGSLNNEQMRDEMINCDAMLIFQPPTTGALTRIKEAQIANIPVIANFDTARSYHRVAQLYEYQAIEEIPMILQNLTKH